MAKIRGYQTFLQVGLAIAAMGAAAAVAQNPTEPREYRVLQRTDANHFAGNFPPGAKPLVVAKPVQPYAYGWFGSKPSMHWHRQFGNRRSYTQWTLK